MGILYACCTNIQKRWCVSVAEKEKFNKTKYQNEYISKKYDSLRIVVPKGKKDKIKAYADSKGESINGFVNKAIDKAMEE
jgi:hypothetical protein